ncbi:MAG: VOC family protein, partial [Candidatus Acidiferrales bacterium]
MVVKELGHIVLYVRDVNASRRFYGELLGWREVSAGGRFAAFSSGRTHHELLLIQTDSNAAGIP